jgi:hypothetical protein
VGYPSWTLCGSRFLSNRSISVLSVPQWQNKSRFFPVWVPSRLISVFSMLLWQKEKDRPPPDLHNFGAPINTFRMNTCKSVSKQRTLSPSRMNTYTKPGGGGPFLVFGSVESLLCALCASVANLPAPALQSLLCVSVPLWQNLLAHARTPKAFSVPLCLCGKSRRLFPVLS